MPVWIVDIGVPIAAGHVAPDPLDADLLLLEIAVGLDDLLQAAALPGDLVDRDLRRELAVGAAVHDRLREQHHRVMVGAVAHEIAVAVAEPGIFWKPRSAGEIGDVGHRETEQVAVEMARLLDVIDIEPEMPEAADLERPVQQNAADIIAMAVGRHQRPPSRGGRAS